MKYLDSELDKFKGVKTGREQIDTILEKLVLITAKIISSVFGFRLMYLCFIAFI